MEGHEGEAGVCDRPGWVKECPALGDLGWNVAVFEEILFLGFNVCKHDRI